MRCRDCMSAADLFELISVRRGHYQLESGYHGERWLDLSGLFADVRRIEPHVAKLADALHPHRVDAVCGPLLGGAFLAQLVAHALGAEFWFTERTADAQSGAMYRARYRLPPAMAHRAAGKRVAIVDDAMSAGSSLRATYDALQSHAATVVAAGALLILGTAGEEFFTRAGIPVLAVARDEYRLWLPEECPAVCRRSAARTMIVR